jgi:hypothetical protein
MKGTLRRTRWIPLIVLLVIAYWIVSQIYWFLCTRPRGISNARDYFARLGDPLSIREIQVSGMYSYEFYAHAPRYLLLLPVSSPPCFVFDDSGRFFDWSPNPVNDNRFSEHWPSTGTVTVSVSEVRQKLGP